MKYKKGSKIANNAKNLKSFGLRGCNFLNIKPNGSKKAVDITSRRNTMVIGL